MIKDGFVSTSYNYFDSLLLSKIIIMITPKRIIEYTIAVVSAFTINEEGNEDIKEIINLSIINSTTPNPILISQSFMNVFPSLD